MTKIVIITILPGQRKRGRSQRQQASKKCRKEKYRDYYIEPDGCRYILSPNPHLHPQDENLCNPAHYDQVGEAVQDVQLCWGRQELRLLHCHQDKAQVILTFLFAEIFFTISPFSERCALFVAMGASSRRTWWRCASVEERKRCELLFKDQIDNLGYVNFRSGVSSLGPLNKNLPSRVQWPNRNCSFENHSSDVRTDCQKEEFEAPDSMSLNQIKNKKKIWRPGHQEAMASWWLGLIWTTPGRCHDCKVCGLLAWSTSTCLG